jgi:sec-independent protein translocase protein TatC
LPGFDLSHLIFVIVIAFLVLGPERMTEAARSLGRFAAESQKQSAIFARSFQEGLQEDSDSATTAAAEEDSPKPRAVSPPPRKRRFPILGGFVHWLRRMFWIRTGAEPIKPAEHFFELRDRLIVSIGAIIVITSIAYAFSDTILYILRAPAGDIKLRAFSPMDGFLVHFRVALYAGIFLTAPIWIYQVMLFIVPGLSPSERRFVVPGVIAMVVLFAAGNLFGYVMLRNMVGVLFTMFGTELEYFPSADQYISFVVYFLLATGLAFELPLVLLILMRIGLIKPDSLRKQRRVAYFIIFVFAELITPVADPIVAPTVVMLPMLILFELALFASRYFVPKPKPAAAPAPAGGTPPQVAS